MKDLRQIQKKKGIRLIIFSILLCFFGIIIFSISNEDKTITGMFTTKCSISNTSDLYQCQKQNSYVKINLTKVYSTTYVYQKHDNTVAYYLDIDLDIDKGSIVTDAVKMNKKICYSNFIGLCDTIAEESVASEHRNIVQVNNVFEVRPRYDTR